MFKNNDLAIIRDSYQQNLNGEVVIIKGHLEPKYFVQRLDGNSFAESIGCDWNIIPVHSDYLVPVKIIENPANGWLNDKDPQVENKQVKASLHDAYKFFYYSVRPFSYEQDNYDNLGGVMLLVVVNQQRTEVRVSWALCHDADNFARKDGKKLASIRMEANMHITFSLEGVQDCIIESKEELVDFIRRSLLRKLNVGNPLHYADSYYWQFKKALLKVTRNGYKLD